MVGSINKTSIPINRSYVAAYSSERNGRHRNSVTELKSPYKILIIGLPVREPYPLLWLLATVIYSFHLLPLCSYKVQPCITWALWIWRCHLSGLIPLSRKDIFTSMYIRWPLQPNFESAFQQWISISFKSRIRPFSTFRIVHQERCY